ncbi:predicted protein [Naegleria gruberi]|uniref:Predicted protein n=1 Tax=Naegleria gruberi TaxID=5762 RepID=D2V835_NAEGR|nr:uncharacterized protein NAEGRDRAFT_65015 [Naegleria gruberi]EFC47109.1 predicted protein [Naegleria gruberi]|eukprot:XP_002679853.1 predicted protein [Naegleria gruberi strain NEG-M]
MNGFSRVDTLSLYGECNFIESSNLGSAVYLPRYIGNVTNLKLFMKSFKNELINWFQTHYSQLKALEINLSDSSIPQYILDEFYKIPFNLEEYKLTGFPKTPNISPMKSLKTLKIEVDHETDFHNIMSSEVKFERT